MNVIGCNLVVFGLNESFIFIMIQSLKTFFCSKTVEFWGKLWIHCQEGSRLWNVSKSLVKTQKLETIDFYLPKERLWFLHFWYLSWQQIDQKTWVVSTIAQWSRKWFSFSYPPSHLPSEASVPKPHDLTHDVRAN